MNNVMNRKMFRPRNARNKLNAMGGIMASSAPLMQTVQKFANGSTPQGVRPGPSTISKFGQVMTPTGYGVSSSFPYNRTTAPQTNPAVQNVIANNLAAQRALNAGIADMPATGLMSPAMARLRAAEARGPRPNFMDFLNRVGEDAKILFGGTNQEIVDATRRKLGIESVVVPKTREGAELDELTPLTADMPSIYGNKQAMSAIADDEVATQSIAAQGSDQLAPTQKTLSRMGAEEQAARTSALANVPENDDADDPTLPVTTPAVPKTTKSQIKKIVVQNAPTTLEAEVEDIDQSAANFAQDIVNAAESLTSETDKNDLYLEVADKKKPDEKLTLKQRFDKNKELAAELGLFKGDADADKKIDGYNLAMMGFLIASGDNPNALSNIAKGAAAGTENFKKTAQARKDRKDKLESFALTNALQDERAEIQWEREMEKYDKGLKYDWMKTVNASDEAKAQTVAKIASTRSNLMVQLANTSAEAKQDRAFKLQYALFSNFDEAMPMAVYQAQQQGLDIGDQETFDDVIMPNALKISDMLAQQKTKTIRPGELGSPERTRSDALERVLELQKIGTTGVQYFGEQGLTPAGQAELNRQMQYITTGQFNTESDPVPVANKEEYDKLDPGTPYVDPEGNVSIKPNG